MAANNMPDALSRDPSKTSETAARVFSNIVELWGLRQTEAMTLLGYDESNRSTYYKWKRDPAGSRLSKEKLERLSYIFGIYKALQILLPQPASADAWLKKPNHAPLFGGNSALDRMLSGNVADLYEVRRYLDAQRGF